MNFDMTVSIIAPAGGLKNFIALDVPVQRFATYSSVVQRVYFPTKGSRNPIAGTEKRAMSNRAEFNLGEGMDDGYARTIAAFIKRSDPDSPALVTLDLFGKDLPVEELIKVWRVVGLGYKVPRQMHDDSIRDDLRQKMYSTNPYSAAQFKLVVEHLDFDRGVVYSAMDRVAFLYIKKDLNDATKLEVEEFCKSREGLWDSLLETLGRVEAKIAEAARLKAARKEKAKVKQAAKNDNTKNCINSPKNKSSNKHSSRGNKGTASKAAGGNSKANKGTPAQLIKPFVRNDEDFPPLA